MVRGIDIARGDAPIHAAGLDDFKDQLLIVFLKRLDGRIEIPVSEIDDTVQDLLALAVRDGVFFFELRRKS